MTARHLYVLSCDHLGCARTFTSHSELAGETRTMAAGEGWGYQLVKRAQAPAKIVDLCKQHQAPPPEPNRAWMDYFHVDETAWRSNVETMYRIDAKRLHPDRGGSTAAMAELNSAWDQAKAWFDWRDMFMFTP